MSFFKRIIFLCAIMLAAAPVFAEGFDHSALDRFLSQYVDTKGRVNYAGAKQNRADLDAYLKAIENADRKSIEAGPKPEVLAFWINVYHAGLLSLILENYPLKSTQEIPSFWDRQFIKVGATGEKEKIRFSLSEIRNDILIPRFSDEKIHLALALGAKDGPLFPREAYTGPRALGLLFKAARREMNRVEMVNIDEDTGRVKLSRVFEWYSPDFLKNYGRPQRRAKLNQTDTAIVNFMIRYAKDLKRLKFLKAANFKLQYPPFDWTLNDTDPVK